ncbi:MAG: hypothetical protein N3G78_05580 [Desulfobacterota bacterium]|nr:hypothetical protein [Thermodesulfobacteriota bacterium]
MARIPCLLLLTLFLLSLFLWGCPKKVEILPPQKPRFEDPISKLLESFSPVESLQARASIRIETVREGEEMNFLLNGFLLYQKPDKLRLLGFHPLGMGLFDALYRNGEIFLLIPPQKRAYIGEVAQFEEAMAKAGEVRISMEKGEGAEIPHRIQIELIEKESRIELRLKGISVNLPLPQESFQWEVPAGVEVRSFERLLRGLRKR